MVSFPASTHTCDIPAAWTAAVSVAETLMLLLLLLAWLELLFCPPPLLLLFPPPLLLLFHDERLRSDVREKSWPENGEE